MLCGECDSAEHFVCFNKFAIPNKPLLLLRWFFLTYNEEYVIMVQNRTILREGRVNVFWDKHKTITCYYESLTKAVCISGW